MRRDKSVKLKAKMQDLSFGQFHRLLKKVKVRKKYLAEREDARGNFRIQLATS